MLLLLLTTVAILKNRTGRFISAGDAAGWRHSTRPWDHSWALPWWQSFKTLAFLTGHLLFLLFPTWQHEYRFSFPQSLCALKHHILGTDCYWARILQAAQITQPCKCHLEPLPPSSMDCLFRIHGFFPESQRKTICLCTGALWRTQWPAQEPRALKPKLCGQWRQRRGIPQTQELSNMLNLHHTQVRMRLWAR